MAVIVIQMQRAPNESLRVRQEDLFHTGRNTLKASVPLFKMHRTDADRHRKSTVSISDPCGIRSKDHLWKTADHCIHVASPLAK